MTAPTVIAFESLYTAIVRRLRAAGTIFDDRVKLVMPQVDAAHWSKLDKPYLLIVPTQTRTPTQLEVDVMRFVAARTVTMVGQFDAQGSEAEYMAAAQIEVAEKQLVYCLCNWAPPQNSSFSFFRAATYGGMRYQDSREPDCRAHFYFTFEEMFQIEDASEIDEADLVAFDGFGVHVSDPACVCPPCESVPSAPRFFITGGGCPQPPQPDPCAEEPCPPIVGKQT